jgi:gliding motility-associated protein GldM
VSAEILNAFKVVDDSLRESNHVLTGSNNEIYKSLDELLADPKTAEKAAIWKPKADQIKAIAAEAYSLIEKQKQELKAESDLDPETGEFREDNIDAPSRYFDTKKNGEILYKKLEEYKNKILAIDPELKKEIIDEFPLSLAIPKSTAGNISTGSELSDWVSNYFNMTPTIAALTILSKFQNDIKNSENLAATFCLNQVGSVKLIMDKFEPLVGTSSTYLMPGEEMTVIAGLGSFNSNAKPEVSVEGRPIAPNANGIAETKFSVGGTGSKSMNVVVKFIDPNTGEAKTVSKQINYTVGAPSGVAVSPNKMNVLYVGVDNPVTITAGAGSEKVSAQFSGGSISKSSGNQYIIRPSAGAYGEQNVTVLVEGKSVGKVSFRVKQLPNPVAYVGNLKPGIVSSSALKAMGGVIAKLEDSEFDAQFEVVSYKVGALSMDIPDYSPVSNSGARWSGSAASLINRLKPGALVSITDIVVKGPDGKFRTLSTGLSYNLQ